LTLVVELLLVWLLFFPRPFRVACFALVTALQIGIIATANYAFLNYIVLSLGFLLLDDGWVELGARRLLRRESPEQGPVASGAEVAAWKLVAGGLPLVVVFYATCADFVLTAAPPPFAWMVWPARALEPFRIANRYGLFAVMTPARYEIEFQGTSDGKTWLPYPFRYKPQALDAAPGIYAPYQPRFEWNLWFASLSSCRNERWVLATEARLLDSDASVLELFAKNPFAASPPVSVRTVASQYWFTDRKTKAETGLWWRRDDIGPYCPAVVRTADGQTRVQKERSQ
jgi:hypothetical protein